MSVVESFIIDEIEKQKSPFPPSLLSRAEKDRLISRATYGLYRWYTDRSQRMRNWNPDRSFEWQAFGTNHSPEVLTIMEGFYAVEQYTPDYTAELAQQCRSDYGSSNFKLRWGSEEEKHADLWRNALLFSRARTSVWLEQYTDDLRKNSWTPPFDDSLRMLLYTVIQEKATQLNYVQLSKIARGENGKPEYKNDADPVLVQATVTIAVDEVAHYDFFLECARVHMYYYPQETLEALVDVLRNFMMPAWNLIPDYGAFVKTAYDADIFNRPKYVREVVKAALKNLGVESVRAIEAGIAKTREVPDESGQMRQTAIFQGLNYSVVEATVERLFERIGRYEREVGLALVDPTVFVRHL